MEHINLFCFDSNVKRISLGISGILSSIVFCSEEPPVINGYGDILKKIYVPDESLELYKCVYDWAEDRIYPRSQLPETLEEALCY